MKPHAPLPHGSPELASRGSKGRVEKVLDVEVAGVRKPVVARNLLVGDAGFDAAAVKEAAAKVQTVEKYAAPAQLTHKAGDFDEGTS